MSVGRRGRLPCACVRVCECARARARDRHRTCEQWLGLQDHLAGDTRSGDLSVGTPHLGFVTWKGPSQLDSSWLEKNVIFCSLLGFWTSEMAFPSWSSSNGGW